MSSMWQYTISTAFRRGYFDGFVTIGDLKRRGGYGLGEFEALAGELIAYDGTFYKAAADGTFVPAGDDELLCFAQITSLRTPQVFDLPEGMMLENAKDAFDAHQRTRNQFFFIAIEGHFEVVTTTAFPTQVKPYPPLSEANQHVAKFTFKWESGRMVGFFSPSYMRDVGVPGYHFHFINDRRTGGGHVTSFKLHRGKALLQPMEEFHLVVPEYQDFLRGNLDP